jgi:hypothetical protein
MFSIINQKNYCGEIVIGIADNYLKKQNKYILIKKNLTILGLETIGRGIQIPIRLI